MADAAKLPLSNTAQRVITALVVAPFIVLAVFVGAMPFALVVTAVSLVGVTEFYLLAHNRSTQGSALVGVPLLLAVILAFYVNNLVLLAGLLLVGAAAAFILETFRHSADVRRSLRQVGMTLAGVLYVGFPAGFLIALRALPNGVVWILLILCVTWGTDSFAYIGGRLMGKTPLAPKLSPRKTVEGALFGVVGGIVPSLILLVASSSVSYAAVLFIVLGPFVAILGDLVELALKRFFQVKDSHINGLNILPGHGGILDRIDALLLVTTLAYLLFMIPGNH